MKKIFFILLAQTVLFTACKLSLNENVGEVVLNFGESGRAIGSDGDGRIVATMSEYYIGIIKGSLIVPTYDDMFDILSAMPLLPNYIGFITGPSRTADIECVATVGVHGPIDVCIIVVEDE